VVHHPPPNGSVIQSVAFPPRTFECVSCDHLEKVAIKTDAMGWITFNGSDANLTIVPASNAQRAVSSSSSFNPRMLPKNHPRKKPVIMSNFVLRAESSLAQLKVSNIGGPNAY
jgi:hypothetical protein